MDGAALVLLARDDLQSLGVDSVGHRLRILRAVAEVRPDDVVAPDDVPHSRPDDVPHSRPDEHR